MLSTSTPAAPRVIVGAASEWRVGFIFWLESSGVAASLRNLVTGRASLSSLQQETQEERDALVTRIEILPGDVMIKAGETVSFAPVAYDSQDTPVSGVNFNWSGRESGSERPVRVSKRGDFTSKNTGSFTVTAEGAGKQAQVSVTVTEGHRLNKDKGPIRQLAFLSTL